MTTLVALGNQSPRLLLSTSSPSLDVLECLVPALRPESVDGSEPRSVQYFQVVR